jgi:hypothetical protein
VRRAGQGLAVPCVYGEGAGDKGVRHRYVVGTGRLRHQLRFGALLLTRAQEARRLLAERRELLEELERAWRDYLGARKD